MQEVAENFSAPGQLSVPRPTVFVMISANQTSLTARFADAFGAPPQVLGSAPGRVNLIGEHVDYNAGLCLPIALPQRTSVALRRRDDDLVRLASAQFSDNYELPLADVTAGNPSGWGAYAAGVLAMLAEDGFQVGGVDLMVDSDVPVGAGLSSSAALAAAVGAAASAAFDLDLLADDDSRARLAEICRRAENQIAGAPTGGMDQAAALRSQAGHALLLDCRDATITQVRFDPEAAGVRLLVINTRTSHELVDGQYAARRADCERAAELLGVSSLREIEVGQLDAALDQLPEPRLKARTQHVVREIERVHQVVAALASADYAEVGLHLTASHASLRYLFEVSSPELDTAVDTALDAGALGARMTGGGFGGSAIALVPDERRTDVQYLLRKTFLSKGWRLPQVFEVTAAGPASAARLDGPPNDQS